MDISYSPVASLKEVTWSYACLRVISGRLNVRQRVFCSDMRRTTKRDRRRITIREYLRRRLIKTIPTVVYLPGRRLFSSRFRRILSTFTFRISFVQTLVCKHALASFASAVRNAEPNCIFIYAFNRATIYLLPSFFPFLFFPSFFFLDISKSMRFDKKYTKKDYYHQRNEKLYFSG